MTHLEDVAERLAKQEASIGSMERALDRFRSDFDAFRGRIEGDEIEGRRRPRRRRRSAEDDLQAEVRDNVAALLVATGHTPDPESRPKRPTGGRLPAEARPGEQVSIPGISFDIDQILVDGIDAEIVAHDDETVTFQVPDEVSEGDVRLILANGRTFGFQLKLDDGPGSRKKVT